MRAYKVLARTHEGALISLVARGYATTIYREGEIIQPPEWLANRGYHLCVFRTLEQACKFAFNFTGSEVWEVMGIPVKGKLPKYGNSHSIACRVLDTDTEGRWPVGTMMMKKLKLVRRCCVY